MMKRQQLRHQLVRQPESVKKSEVENPYEEGKILPNAPEEEIELPSMRPIYTRKQLKRIKRKQNNLKFKKRKQQRALMKDLMHEEILYD